VTDAIRGFTGLAMLGLGMSMSTGLPGFPDHGPPLRIKTMPPPARLTKRQRRRLRGKAKA
jgi:hypothetical protein